MTKSKYRRHGDLDEWLADAPNDLKEPIPLSQSADPSAMKKELQRRFDLALEYLGLPAPASRPHEDRLWAVIDNAFPLAFQTKSKTGQKPVSDLQKRAFVRWIEQKRRRSKFPMNTSAAIKSGLEGNKELIRRFPWLKSLSRGRINNLVSEGRQARKRRKQYLADNFRIVRWPTRRLCRKDLAAFYEDAYLRALGVTPSPPSGFFYIPKK